MGSQERPRGPRHRIMAKQPRNTAKQPQDTAKQPRSKSKKSLPADQQRSVEEALRRRAAQAESIIGFVDHTSLGGDEEAVTGELTTADQHPADTSDITFQRELDLTVRTIAESREAEVQEALHRLHEGKYGICEECGRRIDPGRLKARPEATLCIECQRRREGTVRR